MLYSLKVAHDICFFSNRNKLQILFQLGTKKTPVVIFLDSLDQLVNIKKVSQLQWLPRKLPPDVKFIVSTITHGGYEIIIEKLKLAVPESNITKVLPLGQTDCFDIIEAWLKTANRTLTKAQFQIVEQVFAKCSLPLFTKLVFDEVCRWNSYTDSARMVLDPTIPGLIEQLFIRMEIQHGQSLVKHSLSYVTCAVSGISEVELEDLLSLDDDVLNEAFSFWVPPTRRIPDLLWTRMREDLGNYLVEREADGITVISWYHRQFKEAASKRYLTDKAFKKLIHGNMADFFLGKWASGRKKPFIYPQRVATRMRLERRESEADRKVADQPLFWQRKENGKKVTVYNKRKLIELPYHLLQSGRVNELTKTVIWSYNWMHAKIKAYSPHHVLEDIQCARTVISESTPLKLLCGVIRRAAATLRKEPSTLPVETIGRLYAHKNRSETVTRFLQECESSGRKDCALLPFSQCFDGPISHLIHTLEGHSKGINSIVFSKDSSLVYTASEDGTVACWDMSNGDRALTIDVSDLGESRYTELFMPSDDQILVEPYKPSSDLAAYNTENGDKLYQIKNTGGEFRHDTLVTDSYIIRKGHMFKRHDGSLVKQLECLVNQKNYITAKLSDDERIIFVGQGQGHDVEMYDIDTKHRLTVLPGKQVPSTLSIIGDTVVIGYTVSCTVIFYKADVKDNEKYSKIREFNYQMSFPDVEFIKLHRYRQEVSDIILSNKRDRIVVNLKKCHLFVLNVDGTDPVMLEWESLSTDAGLYTDYVYFTPDDEKIVGLVGPVICVWNSFVGKLLTKFQFSTTEGDKYTLCLAPTENIVATTSKIESNIHVYDLNKLEKESGNETVQRFKHPVNMVAKHSNMDKLYVKSYVRLDSKGGYPKINYFGIDVWDLSSQKHRTFLPFNRYGELKMIVAAPNHPLLALVVCHKHKGLNDIYMINVTSGELQCKVSTSSCDTLVFSQDGGYFMVESSEKKQPAKTVLYSIVGEELFVIPKACSPVFTSGSHAVCLIKPSTLSVINLSDDLTQEVLTLKGEYSHIRFIPNQSDQVILIPDKGVKGTLTVFDIKIGMEVSKIQKVGGFPIVDISEDGRICVDSGQTVYDLRKGKKLGKFSSPGTESKQFVKLTHEGRFVIWADKSPADCIKAADIREKKLVATVATHCKVTSLDVMENGYYVVAGCENGQVLPFKLHTDTKNVTSNNNRHPKSQNIEISSVKEAIVDLMGEEERVIIQQAMSVNIEGTEEKKKSKTCHLV